MALRPGINFETQTAAPSSGSATSTGTAFVVGLAEKGPLGPTLVKSLTAFERTFGKLAHSTSTLHASVSAFYQEGGGDLYVSREVGPGAAAASVTLTDGDDPVVKLVARSVGEYANSWSATAVAEGAAVRVIITQGAETIEQSPVLATKAEALAWADTSSLVTAEPLASSSPIAAQAAQSFAGGTDDRANVTADTFQAALDLLDGDLGPGTVFAPDRSSSQSHGVLLQHAYENNRIAYLQAPVDTTSVAALQSIVNAIKGHEFAEYGALWASWHRVPMGNVTVPVPGSAIQAGIEARRDRVAFVAVPAAGQGYPVRSSRALVANFSRAEYDALNSSGVSVHRVVNGQILPYGYRTVVDQADPRALTFLNQARTRMGLRARSEAIARAFVFRLIDGKGQTLSAYEGALAAICQEYWRSNGLFGDEPTDAYRVLTGEDVNPYENLANGEISAVLQVRFSPQAELVSIVLVRTPTSEVIA